jgi:thymidylate synthase
MNNLDKQYKELLETIINYGVEKKDRTGTGTKSIFGYTIRHNMKDGFPALTTKKLAWKQVVSELLWFLTGQTNISFLLKHNNHIWDGDAYKSYQKVTQIEIALNQAMKTHPHYNLSKEQFIERIQTDKEFAKNWGDLGPIYGKQWRKWDGNNGRIDQIDNLINELKTNPDSRRLMVSAWNVGELDMMTLPPCHYGFQVWTREENGQRYISLMWNQRSVDTFLGLPFNIASYGLLLHIIANEVDMIPDELIGNLGDVHLYSNHIEQAKEQISREPFDLPQLKTNAKIDGICCNVPDDFVLEGYQSHPTIKAPLSN